MKDWDTCQNDLITKYANDALKDALSEFRTILFASLQRGFQVEEGKIKQTITGLINTCLESNVKAPCWKELCDSIDDYSRLATAEIFSDSEKNAMKNFSHNASVFYRLSYNCNLSFQNMVYFARITNGS